ncbi:hypothetical protein ANO11243_088120 [Dothideomycetidae sp. 11243]|nr:hypothetical protein ANO11243_088120 [fungal sp. No.11243]
MTMLCIARERRRAALMILMHIASLREKQIGDQSHERRPCNNTAARPKVKAPGDRALGRSLISRSPDPPAYRARHLKRVVPELQLRTSPSDCAHSCAHSPFTLSRSVDPRLSANGTQGFAPRLCLRTGPFPVICVTPAPSATRLTGYEPGRNAGRMPG